MFLAQSWYCPEKVTKNGTGERKQENTREHRAELQYKDYRRESKGEVICLDFKQQIKQKERQTNNAQTDDNTHSDVQTVECTLVSVRCLIH